MTLQEAVAILRAHNEWRRGNRSESWHDPMPYSPAELGMAIDVVCDHIEHPLGMARSGKGGRTMSAREWNEDPAAGE